jgi:hypothetical protein
MGNTSISLNDYLAYIRDTKNASPHTLDLFTRTLRACALSTVEPDNLSATWKYLLERFESKQTAWAFVLTAIKIVKAAIKYETGASVIKDKSYNDLVGKLSKHRRDNPNPRVEYTIEDIENIVQLSYENSRQVLFPAVVLMTLSGLRVGGCESVKFDDFRKVENVPDVRLFLVKSKGDEYYAAISEYGYQLLEQTRSDKFQREYVVPHSATDRTPFESIIRSRLRYMLVQKFAKRDMLKDKPMLHAFRKFALTQMASTLHKEDLALLAGHKIIGSTAFKFYVGKNKEKPTPQFDERIANAYKQTPLFTLRFKSLEHGTLAEEGLKRVFKEAFG